MAHKYGLKPITEQPRVKLRDFYTSDLPSVGSLKFPLGHADKIQPEMFLNDELGCCAESGSWEEVRLANALRGVTVNVSDASVLKSYKEISGYNPDDPSTDQGTDVHVLMEYRKTTGLVDDDGKAHKIVAYAGLTPGDWDEMLVALSQFDIVPIGISMPDYAQDQFADGQPWHLIPGRHQIVGGHYVPIVGATDANTAQLYSWDGVGGITAPFYAAHNLVAVVALTAEMFTGDKGPDGIDFEKLQAELPSFNTGKVTSKAPKRKAEDVKPVD